jgi:hypothetical protein
VRDCAAQTKRSTGWKLGSRCAGHEDVANEAHHGKREYPADRRLETIVIDVEPVLKHADCDSGTDDTSEVVERRNEAGA